MEFWFCTDYTIGDKCDHVRDITPIKVINMNPGDDPKSLSKVPSEKKYEVAPGDDSGSNMMGHWDRHSTVHTRAVSLWFMSNSDQDVLIKSKFEVLLHNIGQLLKTKDEISQLFPK